MAFDFPNSPTIGQIASGPGIQWQWDGAKWVVMGGSTRAYNNITITSIPPTSPAAGDLWWNTNDGNLYIFFNDGTSSQWVVANSSNPSMPEAPTDGRNYLRQGSSQSWLPGQPLAGVIDGSNAVAGAIGEYIQAINPNITSNISASGGWFIVTSISLTPGDWDVEGMAYVIVGGPISNYAVMVSNNTTPGGGWPPATAPFSGAQYSSTGTNVLSNSSLFTGVTRWSLTATTTMNLHFLCTAVSASSAYAAIRARRVR